MTPECRKALDDIDAVLSRGDRTAEDLWNVLTALRGPDNKEHADKAAFTVHVRIGALPRTAQAMHRGDILLPVWFGEPTMKPDPDIVLRAAERAMEGEHFAYHAWKAVEALWPTW